MKKFILLTILALSMSAAAFAQKKELTVKEYFLAIPTGHLPAESKKRAAWITSESADDGFLSYEISAEELTGEKGDVLFTMDDSMCGKTVKLSKYL